MSNVIGLNGKTIESVESPVKAGTFEFHMHSNAESGEEVTKTTGYLKFGPQFIAVVDGPEDSANVVFACSTPLVKYVKRVTEDGTVEATLAP